MPLTTIMLNAKQAAWVALGQAIAMLLMYLFITVTTILVLWKLWNRRRSVLSPVTPTLTMHLVTCCFAGFVGTIWTGYLVAFWQADIPYSAIPFYWTNIANLIVVLSVITAAIFLNIDRICAITMLPSRYYSLKKFLGKLSITCVIATLIGNTIFVMTAGETPRPDLRCWNLRCSSTSLIVNFFIFHRYIALVIYAVAAITCLYWLRWYNSNKTLLTVNSNTIKTGEDIVKFTIYSMFLFGMMPLLISVISANIFNFALETYFGMFTRVFVAVDGTLVAWKYYSSLSNVSRTPQVFKGGGGTVTTVVAVNNPTNKLEQQ